MKRSQKTWRLVSLAMLSAILFLLTITPLGYLKLGFADITFLMIPVAIGAMAIGVGGGTFLGFIFGLTSFLSALGVVSPSAFGALLVSISPARAAVVCLVPRVLMGFLCGVLYRSLDKKYGDKVWVYAVTSASSAILNTVFFMGALALFFHPMMAENATAEGKGIFLYIVSVSLLNAIGEIAASVLIGVPVSKAVCRFLKRA